MLLRRSRSWQPVGPRVQLLCQRCIDTDVESLLGRTLDKSYRRKNPAGLQTTRAEAIDLYRDIWRYSRLFVWNNEHGRPWRDVLRESARQEFDLARQEQDPELVSRMIVAGRDAVQQAVDKFMARREQLEQQAPVPGNPTAL